MAKVISSAGLQEFVMNGTVQTSEQVQPENSPPAASVPQGSNEPAATPADAPGGEPAAEGKVQEDLLKDAGIEREFTPEERKQLGAKVEKAIASRHRRMKEAQEEATDAGEFAKSQYLERRQIELERDALRAQLQSQQPPQQAAPAEVEPQVEAYKLPDGSTDWVKYVKDHGAWTAKQAVLADRAERERAAAQAQFEEQEAATRARFEEAQARYPDFKEVMGKAHQVLMHRAVIQYIREAELGPDLTYHLVTHPDEAKRIMQLNPLRAVAETAKLEARIKGEANAGSTAAQQTNGKGPAPVAENKPAAPPPITPLSASGAGALVEDPAKMTFRQLREFERKRQAERRR